MADTFWKGFSVWKLSPSNRPKTELFGEKKCGKSPAAARSPLSLVFRAMLSLGSAREALVCLRENLRTQGLRFQERVGQVNFRYVRGVVLKVSGRCVHLGWRKDLLRLYWKSALLFNLQLRFRKSMLGACILGGAKSTFATRSKSFTNSK